MRLKIAWKKLLIFLAFLVKEIYGLKLNMCPFISIYNGQLNNFLFKFSSETFTSVQYLTYSFIYYHTGFSRGFTCIFSNVSDSLTVRLQAKTCK